MIRSGIARGKDEAEKNHGGVAGALGLKLEDLRRFRINAVRYTKDFWQVALPAAVKLLEHPEEVAKCFAGEPGLFEVFCDVCQAVLDADEAGGEPDFSPKVWQVKYTAKRKKERCDVTDDILSAVFLSGPVSESIGATAMKMLFGNHAPAVEDFARNTAAAQGWPELRSLSGPEPAEILTSDLPGVLGQIARAIQQHSETPGALSVFCILGIIATAVQRKFQVKLDGEHRETLSLFLLCALAPGERKSAVLEIVRQPLTKWESEKRIELAPIIRELSEETEVLNARVSQLRSRAGKTDDVHERRQLLEEIVECCKSMPVIPSYPTLTTSDATPEALGRLMARQGERMTVVSDEGGIFETIGGRYARGIANVDLFMQGFSGSPWQNDRAKEQIRLRHAAISIVLCVQPSVIFGAIENEVFRSRGFVQRFLLCMPVSRLGFRKLTPVAIPQSILMRWQDIIMKLCNEPQHEDDSGELIARTILLTPEAEGIWKRFQREMEVAMRPGEEWDFETGWCSKAPGAIGRLAAVIHSGLCAARGRSPDDVPIDASIMTAAVSLGRKIAEHTRVAFRGAGVDRGVKLANKVASWLERERPESFSSRDLQRQVCNGERLEEQELTRAIEELQEAGWIRPLESQSSERGGRPSRRWEVHPLILACGPRGIADRTDKTGEEQGGGEVLSVLSGGFAFADDGEVESGEVLSVVSESSAMSGGKGANTVLDAEAIEWAENACSGGGR
jgi:hypothetical protein